MCPRQREEIKDGCLDIDKERQGVRDEENRNEKKRGGRAKGIREKENEKSGKHEDDREVRNREKGLRDRQNGQEREGSASGGAGRRAHEGPR